MGVVHYDSKIHKLHPALIKNIEKKVGLPIEEIRRLCPVELREYLKKRTEKGV